MRKEGSPSQPTTFHVADASEIEVFDIFLKLTLKIEIFNLHLKRTNKRKLLFFIYIYIVLLLIIMS